MRYVHKERCSHHNKSIVVYNVQGVGLKNKEKKRENHFKVKSGVPLSHFLQYVDVGSLLVICRCGTIDIFSNYLVNHVTNI